MGELDEVDPDRQAAEEFNRAIPGNDTWADNHANANRAFLGRAGGLRGP